MAEQCALTAVSFQRLSDDDIRNLSVLQVKTLDDLRSDAMGGLIQCSTCGRSSNVCSGHFGHIELPVPIEHPLFLGQTYNVLPVPPTRLRYPNREHDAPLTSLLRRVLCAVSRHERAAKLNRAVHAAEAALALAVRAYFTNSNADGLAGLCTRLRGKQGILRQQLMGWRVNSCARSVIAPDPLVAPWEVGVPGRVADKLQLRDGDRVIMNRQPSLHRGSMMGHVVRVRPHDFCFSLSPTITPPYNADFDGDEMNLHITSMQSQADAIYAIGVEHCMLSVASGNASVRLVQDGCLGQFLMHGLTSRQQRARLVQTCEALGQVRAAQQLHQQQLQAHNFLQQHGFSIGVDDFVHAVPCVGRNVHALGKVAENVNQYLPTSNHVRMMVDAGSKGSTINLAQLYGCVGLQTVRGKPAEPPLFDAEADAFVEHSFTEGLTETEFWMHACASREGMVQTAIKTADSGYLMRRMVKSFENITVCYDDTVRTSAGQVVQFVFGGDGIDPSTAQFKNPRQIEPGTPVGILCAQSLGEKLTQLTLDTFHSAGIAFKHGLQRVKQLLDASKSATPMLRNAKQAHCLVRYSLQQAVVAWDTVDVLPERATLEAHMRQYKLPNRFWRGQVKTDLYQAWHVAVRVRCQCACVCDETYVYAWQKPQHKLMMRGAEWAGPAMLDNSVPVLGKCPLMSHGNLSEPCMVIEQLGVEAARAVLISELTPCMGGVDRRHMELLADAMTYTGKVLGANRSGIRQADENSILGRACFETAPHVLAQAASQGSYDPLLSASSRLAVGMLPRMGAHMCDVSMQNGKPRKAQSMLEIPLAKRARFGAFMKEA